MSILHFAYGAFHTPGQVQWGFLNLVLASIAQLAEHVPRKHKVTSSILVGGSLGPLV